MSKREQAKRIFLQVFGEYQILGYDMDNKLSLEEVFDKTWEIFDYGGLLGVSDAKKEQIYDLMAEAVTGDPKPVAPAEARRRLELILSPSFEPSDKH